MNKVFTRTNKIVLDDSYQLESDGDSGIVLTFSEIRQRKIKQQKNKKIIYLKVKPITQE